MSRWAWLWRLVSRRLWFRAAAFSFAAALLALVAPLIAPLIPYELGAKIGADAVDNILGIIASSMLAVTTFSLTAMVSAYGAATANVTPRAVILLLEDTTSQNALSTFLGAFLFAIVGIIALSTGFYGEQGRVLLFGGTIALIVVIAVTLLRWIQHIALLGRVHDTITRVERAAMAAVQSVQHRPRIAALATPPVPADAQPVRCGDRIGHVTNIDLSELGEAMAACGGHVHLAVLPGSFVDPGRVVAWVVDGDEATCARVAESITVQRDRSFDHDPRFGLIVLSEIASRALSPAVNDPGTAIAVLGAQLRVLQKLAGAKGAPFDERVVVPALAIEKLVVDAFRPIARDGAAHVEVAMKLQKTLAALGGFAPDWSAAARHAADDARHRARAALSIENERLAVARAFEDWPE
ncbi:DUF2254 domain-containing protein [Sphingomonas suaedae]|uniref:DUF2254 domain-containing protein n=1 Tax=Sphingomonas suaedae TaxID=2599297 RepID=A0A518RFY9_9SPHN|nr:DUF2254 domain-containing protein [Sphingomonas suaedae]QDX26363.1 DUF2254 domain-containing protein [Sphingomonas suaedae]